MTYHTRAFLAALAVGILICVAGCGSASSRKGTTVDEHLTKQAAMNRVLHYLRQSLTAVPEGVSLDARGAKGRSSLAGEQMTGCANDDGYNPKTTPSQVAVSYWLVGLPKAREDEYLKKISKLWESWGFRLGDGATSDWAPFQNKDGYSLNINVPKRKPDSISVGAGTPCIKPPFDNAKPLPEVIRHPAK